MKTPLGLKQLKTPSKKTITVIMTKDQKIVGKFNSKHNFKLFQLNIVMFDEINFY